MRHQHIWRCLAFLVLTLGSVHAGAGPVDFPSASPESQGLATKNLEHLAAMAQGYVEQGELVGAELLVIKNRRTVLHRAFGWRDRELELPMAPNSIFNIRSMTKAVVGTVAQMLIDEGRLSPDDPVAKYLPSFDNDRSRSITVEHLMTHRSGLPMTMLQASLDGYSNLEEIAALAGEHGPDFTPGSAFRYSDAGSEALGVVLEKVSGLPLGTLTRQRVLEPLGMSDTLTLIDKGDPRMERVCSGYAGQAGRWARYWSPAGRVVYPFMLGSQSLYASPMDYARFLTLWLDEGHVGQRRLLTSKAIGRGLTPVSRTDDMPTSFDGLEVHYGQMWQLWVDPDASGESSVVAFGHGGSDGTQSYAWPEQDLMVLFFTQSRGALVGLNLEAEIERLLVKQEAEAKIRGPAIDYGPYIGTYLPKHTDVPGRAIEVRLQGDRLALRMPEGLIAQLQPPDEEGIWRSSFSPMLDVSFDRNHAGEVTTLWLYDPVNIPRKPAAEQPKVSDVPEQYKPYVGVYSIRVNLLQTKDCAVIVQDGALAGRGPEGNIYRLRDADELGRWYLIDHPKEYLIFERDESEAVTGMKLFEVHELVRGEVPAEPELALSDVQKYLGTYHDPQANVDVKLVFRDGRVAIESPAIPIPVELFPPNDEGLWRVRLSPQTGVRFNLNEQGEVVSYTAVTPMGDFVRPRVKPAEQAKVAPVDGTDTVETVFTVVYDNNAEREGLVADWGFGCLIQGPEKTILFDTGAKGEILLDNMSKLGLDPTKIDAVVLSHIHWDHVGGLDAVLSKKPKLPVYIPAGFPDDFKAKVRAAGCPLHECDESIEVCPGVRTTGTLGKGQIVEHSLCVQTGQGWVLVTGCAHPGVDNLAAAARKVTGKAASLVFGGFHLPPKSESAIRTAADRVKINGVIGRLEELGVGQMAPCHCSGDMARSMFKAHFEDRCELIGVGHAFRVVGPGRTAEHQ